MSPARKGAPASLPGAGIAVATALAMIAYQVAGKATRDALFLSSFPVSALPAMTIASAILSVAMAFVASKALLRFGPGRVIPFGFAGSAIGLVVEWLLQSSWPRPVAVAVYLHYGALGALLVSGFWSFLNERYDPRTAKRALGRVAAGGTVGGLLGGFLADRVGSLLTVAAMLPILAVIHATCAALAARLRASAPPPSRHDASEDAAGPRESGLRILGRSPYLQTLVTLVVLVTVSEGLVDWLFKARAAAAMARGEDLLRLFGAFYTGVSLLTVVVQVVFSRVALERLGLARSVAMLPASVGLGSIGALAWPGLPSALALRATESVVSNSLYRSGYEILFTPVPQGEKRAVKSLVDVGAARVGDFAGAAVVQVALVTVGLSLAPTMIVTAVILVGLATLAVAYRLHGGYVRALARGLVARAIRLDLSDVADATTRSTMLQSFAGREPVRERAPRPASTTAAGSPPEGDATARRAAALASGRAEETRIALRDGPLPASLIPSAVSLLAWDDVAHEAIEALRSVPDAALPHLVPALADPESDFAIRRRVPLVLGVIPDAAAVEALLAGLADRRFEVRYRCGRALHHLVTTHPRLGVPPEHVFEAVRREVGTERRVWEGQRLLDRLDDESWTPLQGEALRSRANRSLEHVFTLLSLALPRTPLRLAYRGLLTEDAHLRGTALEYLEATLPSDIRKQLWPYLEDSRPHRAEARSADDVLRELLASDHSIAIQLRELKVREAPRPKPPPEL